MVYCNDRRQYQKRISVEKEFSLEESSLEEPLPAARPDDPPSPVRLLVLFGDSWATLPELTTVLGRETWPSLKPRADMDTDFSAFLPFAS